MYNLTQSVWWLGLYQRTQAGADQMSNMGPPSHRVTTRGRFQKVIWAAVTGPDDSVPGE